ncbi:GAF domain-containing protein, partial [Haliangium sp. UPWRP_2]|uniref:GAF domain-containing sensor histidine kinase n=1 Tax=Haliangium sp. UPWRP_2 TaxID=1931276 RepID=UPI0011B1E54E
MADDRTESERTSLHYFECLDRVTRVFAQASDVEELIRQTLQIVLEIFACDRAWLLFPCDPEAASWRIFYEATRPERPGALAINVGFPMDEPVADLFREALQTSDPITYGVHRPHPWVGAPNFDIRSQIHIALKPRRGAAWLLGLHQCSYARDWTTEESRLFHEIAQRLADALTNLLYTRELEQTAQALRDSEALLRKSEAALREADRRKDEFLGMLSHELRNPLAPIRNSLYILERAAPGSEQAKRAQAVIDRQVRHMTRLVDDLLDITRIARGKIQLQRQRVELGELVRRTIEDHRTELLANGCELAVAIAEEALWAEVDATRIAQVIGNLLQNAAKFTPRGGKIAVSIARDDDAAI